MNDSDKAVMVHMLYSFSFYIIYFTHFSNIDKFINIFYTSRLSFHLGQYLFNFLRNILWP